MARQKSRAAKAASRPRPKKAAAAKRKPMPGNKTARRPPARKAMRPKPGKEISRKISGQKIMRETFALPPPKPPEFRNARMAPPEEPFSLSHPAKTALAYHAKKSAIPAPLAAMALATAITALLAAFLTLALGMNPFYTLGISMAVFVGFSIVFYTIIETSE